MKTNFNKYGGYMFLLTITYLVLTVFTFIGYINCVLAYTDAIFTTDIFIDDIRSQMLFFLIIGTTGSFAVMASLITVIFSIWKKSFGLVIVKVAVVFATLLMPIGIMVFRLKTKIDLSQFESIPLIKNNLIIFILLMIILIITELYLSKSRRIKMYFTKTK